MWDVCWVGGFWIRVLELSGANSVVDFWVLEYSTQMKEKLKAGEKRN
jgi:hypothetical protein